jgi:hypothetical protein
MRGRSVSLNGARGYAEVREFVCFQEKYGIFRMKLFFSGGAEENFSDGRPDAGVF